jgi:gp36
MQGLELFEYTGHEIRVQVDESGEPLFVLADLAAALGIANVAQLRSRLSDDLCLTYPMRDRLGRAQQVWVVTEPGLYEVVIRSDKPEAVAFRRWVTGEVLPSMFGTVLSARVEGMGPNRFCRWLRNAGYVYRRGGQMVPTARAITQGLLEASEVQVPGGGVRVQTWVLPKGQERFARELLAERAEAS